MQKYIALLRGINVSGQKIIKMADLRVLLSDIGLSNVSTYIQTGNIFFESNKDDIYLLENCIKDAIKKRYLFEVPSIVLKKEDVQRAIERQPFYDIDFKCLYLTFLSDTPNSEGMKQITNYQTNGEELILIEKVLYMHSPNGVAKSKLTLNLIEKKLEVKATTRNWRTCGKLLEMLN
ncbi:MAG: DUF1697 domain-containing protein [Flavobacteriales bacterium]|nr:DUF1697 domain-containing protein [Flavobacteriales bacterium]